MEKEILKTAYEAGVKSVELNKDRDRRLESGVKQIEAEFNFENWFNNLQIQKSSKKEYSFEESNNIAHEVINGYSELRKLRKSQIGSAQLFHAMESYHEEMIKNNM